MLFIMELILHDRMLKYASAHMDINRIVLRPHLVQVFRFIGYHNDDSGPTICQFNPALS